MLARNNENVHPTVQSLPLYLKPEVFAPLAENKEEHKHSPYENGIVNIETYPLIKLNIDKNNPEERQKFIDDIEKLLSQCRAFKDTLGIINSNMIVACICVIENAKIRFLRSLSNACNHSQNFL